MVARYDVAPLEGYEPEIGLLLAALDDGTREWTEELSEVDATEIVRRPFEGGPSIGAQLLHLMEVEAWWIQVVVGARPLSADLRRRLQVGETDVDEGRWCDAPAMPLADYLVLFDEVRRTTKGVLLDERDPARALQPSPDRRGMTVRWVVGHVVQHDSYHGGQAVLVKRMLRGGMW